MRYHKPDFIVILAVLVSIGVIATTTAQAGEAPNQGITAVSPATLTAGAEKIRCDECPVPVRHKDVVVGPQATVGGWHGSATAGQSVLDSFYRQSPKGFYHPRGVRYDLMFNSFHAVMYMGGSSSLDFTLKLDNLHTPAEDLDPYLSLSLGSRW
jgi:hypothetical protein